MDKSDCYEYGGDDIFRFFQEKYTDDVIKATKNANFVHLFYHMSSKYVARTDSNIAAIIYAKEFCPRIFNSLDWYF